MRTTLLTLGVLLALSSAACSRATSPGTIPPDQAASHIGQTVTVEGSVTEVYTAKSGAATFIDMGGEHPEEAFTGVVFAGDMAAVGGVSDLKGQIVDIHGLVQLYRGKPEIVIGSRGQINER